MAVSARSSTPLEEVAAAAGPDAALWAQLDIRKDRSITLQHAQRAKRCGCTAIVLTVDHPFISGTAARSAENESQQKVFNEISTPCQPLCAPWAADATFTWTGGVRSGDDVVKALCLGAKAVFVGRPALYGLAYNGEEGVTAVLECIRKELCTCLSLIGCHDVQKLHRGFLVRRSDISYQERR
ncbi:hypothetical protein HPB48_013052 [Haemaphysalis longicornis]|uniref:FMN hydroxy acid dehydrogenase domain-containing protein n=1 Tax=Haemaphysalis longicornis TaxID=44386 RepID=A0A9J6G256_HAELO|nr:hypothetical protein HPB48_013052 [Haemaphysalis longicornis]